MRKVIKASEGYILTNGKIYGSTIYLANGVDESTFYEITIEEYNELMEVEPEPEVESEEAGIKDYQTALQRLGVNI